MTLSALLKGLGYEVTEAEHGGDAWATDRYSYFLLITATGGKKRSICA